MAIKEKGGGGGGLTSIERRLQCLPATEAEIEQPVFGLVRWFPIRQKSPRYMAAMNNLIGSPVANQLRQERATESNKVGVQRLMPVAAAVVGLSLLHS